MELAGVFDIEKPRRGERSGKSESIEPSRRTTTNMASALCPRRQWSRWEASERHGQSPQNRSAGALRSIEPSCGPTTKSPTIWHIAECPRREWSPRERRDIDQAQRASAWVMRESIEPRRGTTTKFTHCKTYSDRGKLFPAGRQRKTPIIRKQNAGSSKLLSHSMSHCRRRGSRARRTEFRHLQCDSRATGRATWSAQALVELFCCPLASRHVAWSLQGRTERTRSAIDVMLAHGDRQRV
jgi:hypothetical protein